MIKEKAQQDLHDQDLVIDINLNRGLVIVLSLVLLAVSLLGYLAWNYRGVAASSSPDSLAASNGMRKYWLTKGTYGGAVPFGVCGSGYHFASLWEILDPSNLEYNTTLGYTRADSGSGPPSAGGWIRTGYDSNNTNTAGLANCSAWSNTLGHGTVALLPHQWKADWEDLHVWNISTIPCNDVRRVWCIENRGFLNFLPLVSRSFP